MTEDEQSALLIRLDERTERMTEDVGQLRHTLLEGNGTPAVTVQLAQIHGRLDSLERTRTEDSENKAAQRIPRYVWLGILASVLLSIAGFAYTYVTGSPAPTPAATGTTLDTVP